MKILIGSTFPLVLIRRSVLIRPKTLDILRQELQKSEEIHSFWGHNNTLATANKLLNTNLTPKIERPALYLNENLLPTLDNEVFQECWVLSPNYISGFRPKIGIEVTEKEIMSWNVLNIDWRNIGDA
jgi:hypothetical protein